ncbi:hypothetical protein PFWH6_0781 [Pseudomonas fluorescens WH6]|nr:hypothetical protein PFWH6_0781 [Pseudomonas fluorescens WH6]
MPRVSQLLWIRIDATQLIIKIKGGRGGATLTSHRPSHTFNCASSVRAL